MDQLRVHLAGRGRERHGREPHAPPPRQTPLRALSVREFGLHCVRRLDAALVRRPCSCQVLVLALDEAVALLADAGRALLG